MNLVIFVTLRGGREERFLLAVSFVEREEGFRVIDLSGTWK